MAFKRFIALIIALLMVVSMLPAVHAGARTTADGDIWAQISAFEDAALAKRARASGDPTAADFAALSEDVERLVVNSGDCVPGSVIRHGSFFYWTTTSGEVCGYSPALRARMHAAGVHPDADPEALSGIETTSCAVKGGSPGSVDVAVFQPYKGLDSNFTDQYANEGKRIAEALGGTSATYKTTAATVDQIAAALEDCAVVIFDSHGDTDYYNPRNTDDYVTQANTSYLCMQTNAGWTSEDKQPAEGPYGTYYHAYNAGSYGSVRYYCVDGTVLANHMQKAACNNLLWMAICLGMATDGMFKPLREKGVEVVYGYSQSVSFDGDYDYEESFWNHMRDGYTVGSSFAYMKEQAKCNWDPVFPRTYSLSRARYEFAAFPNVVSSEDEYQGHRTGNPKNAYDSAANQNNDPAYGACNIQTARSTWRLFRQFTVTAVSNNDDWGTVSVADETITASPREGYYAAGYEVISGGAEVVQNGNVFTVTATSDCTVRIDFAAKTPAAVRFVTPDGVTCEPRSAYVGDEIILPAPEGTPTADAQDYRFFGWSNQTVADTTDQPSCAEAGSAWTVEAEDTVFYALYTYGDPPHYTTELLCGHDYAAVVTEPTCNEGGFTTYTCSKCGDSYIADETDPLGHDWDDPAYLWAADYSEITATRTCKNDESHVETEKGAITSEVTREATINAEGEITYIATFTNSAFAAQTAPVAVPKLDDGLPCDGGETCPGSVFTDMPAKGDWAHDAIDWAFVHGVTAGTSATTFSPNNGCTRAQVVTFLWRAAGSPDPNEAANPFADVREDAYYYAAVLWAVENEITTGTATDKFSPDATCTRAQIVTFLWRYAGKPAPAADSNPFKDVKDSDYFYQPVLWASGSGVTAGTSATAFSPADTCTRAQVVTFLYRDLAA